MHILFTICTYTIILTNSLFERFKKCENRTTAQSTHLITYLYKPSVDIRKRPTLISVEKIASGKLILLLIDLRPNVVFSSFDLYLKIGYIKRTGIPGSIEGIIETYWTKIDFGYKSSNIYLVISDKLPVDINNNLLKILRRSKLKKSTQEAFADIFLQQFDKKEYVNNTQVYLLPVKHRKTDTKLQDTPPQFHVNMNFKNSFTSFFTHPCPFTDLFGGLISIEVCYGVVLFHDACRAIDININILNMHEDYNKNWYKIDVKLLISHTPKQIKLLFKVIEIYNKKLSTEGEKIIVNNIGLEQTNDEKNMKNENKTNNLVEDTEQSEKKQNLKRRFFPDLENQIINEKHKQNTNDYKSLVVNNTSYMLDDVIVNFNE